MAVYGVVTEVKRKRFVDEKGIHYPVRTVTLETPLGFGHEKSSDVIRLEFDEHEGQNIHGLKKGVHIVAHNFMVQNPSMFYLWKPKQSLFDFRRMTRMK